MPDTPPTDTPSSARPVEPEAALAGLWAAAGLPAGALDRVVLTGREPVLASSFAVATAVQVSLAAAALAAAELAVQRRAPAQTVTVDMARAALDSCGHFSIDGRVPNPWDPLSGLYRCGADVGAPGWVRIHANFAHHRDGALRLLGCPTGPTTDRAAVTAALRRWSAEAFEDAAAEAGLVVAALRTFDAWDRHPQALALRAPAPLSIEPIPGAAPAAPRSWPALASAARPLHGLKVVDLTRILAGPVAGRTLASFGAEVMLVNAPNLPNIEAIADTSRGKLSAHVDLAQPAGRQALQALLRDSHVLLQSYRPGAIDRFGFGAEAAAALRPGIVHVSLSAYGFSGPWAARRGFDSLVQTATGFNHAEAEAAGLAEPKPMPLQVLDYGAAYVLAFGAQAALWRQAREGGSWQVRVSLAGVGHWLRSLGRVPDGLQAVRPGFAAWLETVDSGFGRLAVMPPTAQFSRTPAGWSRPSMPPGTHPPRWPDA